MSVKTITERTREMNAKIMKVYVGAVGARCKANGHSGWGGDDSTYVIEALTDEAYTEYPVLDKAGNPVLNEKGEPKMAAAGFDAIRELVGKLVNPSAHRQMQEKLEPTNPCYVKPGEKGKRGGVSEALNALKAAGLAV